MLGVGGLGRVMALELAADPRVEELVLADKRGDRSRALKSIGHAAVVRPVAADVTRPEELQPVLEGVDVAVNTSLPDYNLTLLDACLEAGCGFTDPWGLSPVGPGERPGVLAELERDAAWKARGRTAVVSMGSDPGISDLLAREAADRLRTVDEIRILKAAAGGGPIEGYPLYSRAVFLRDALAQPVVWDGAKVTPQPFVSGEEDYAFPDPIGLRHVYQVYHEEIFTLSLRLGRAVGRIVYKHDLNPDLVRAAVALQRLGLLDEGKIVHLGATRMTFRDAFLAAFPEPSTFVGPVSGAMAVLAEVLGTKPDGRRARVRASLVVDHREANRRRGTTAERYLTAAALASAVSLVAQKGVLRAGVLAPAELPAEPLRRELESRGFVFAVDERPA